MFNFDGYLSSFYSFHNLFEFVISYYSFTTLFFPLPIFRFSSLNPTININIFFLVSHLRLPSQTSPVYYRSKLNPKMIFSLLSLFINFSKPHLTNYFASHLCIDYKVKYQVPNSCLSFILFLVDQSISLPSLPLVLNKKTILSAYIHWVIFKFWSWVLLLSLGLLLLSQCSCCSTSICWISLIQVNDCIFWHIKECPIQF